MRLTKKKKWTLLLALSIAIIGLIVYRLADRYLIEHVEVKLTAIEASGSSLSDEPAPVEETETGTAQAAYDDWSYTDDDTSIQIKKAESGSGSDKITYFVADVRLSGSASLQSAFAENAFGRNITETTSAIAAEHDAIFAVNGDYYGFRDDGVIIRNGTLFRDEPARDALALYADGTLQTYSEESVSSSELLSEGVTNTYSFGPILVKDGSVANDFGKVSIDTNFGNRSIQGANPRTGIGMIAPNHYVFVVVDGRKENYSKGMTLAEFAQVFADLGCTEAYNLDGGGSSTMYFMGKVVNNPGGKEKERGVSDVIYIAEQA